MSNIGKPVHNGTRFVFVQIQMLCLSYITYIFCFCILFCVVCLIFFLFSAIFQRDMLTFSLVFIFYFSEKFIFADMIFAVHFFSFFQKHVKWTNFQGNQIKITLILYILPIHCVVDYLEYNSSQISKVTIQVHLCCGAYQ